MRQAEIVDTEASDSDEDGGSGGSGPEHQLYTRGQRSEHFTLVLQASCSLPLPECQSDSQMHMVLGDMAQLSSI